MSNPIIPDDITLILRKLQSDMVALQRLNSTTTAPTYTVATRPSAVGQAGAIIYVSDGGAGSVFQGSDGATWVSLG